MQLKRILLGASALALMASAAQAERGADGQVNILYWQAVSIMNPFLSSGTKDIEAASLVLEPLARFDETGQITPYLAEDIPTLENGGISEDLTTITWTLKEGLLWSDGTPVTAADAVFTWQYCTHPEGGCAQSPNFGGVSNVEAVDDRTIRITFAAPQPYPYGPLVGGQSPLLQAAQFADCLGARAPECTDANFMPIGTGPFVVTDFKANDVVTLEANPNYRDPAKPAFQTVVLKGGGDAASAARSVLETGEFDYAWNAQVEPEILDAMAAAGRGEVISSFGTLVERIHVNQTNPDPALGDTRSTTEHPHPFLTDPNVVKALSLAIDREILVETGYGAAGQVTCNLVPAPDYNASPNNDWCKTQDLDEANRLLDEAGAACACRYSTRPRPTPCARLRRRSSSSGGRRSGSRPSCATSTRACSSAPTRARPTRCRSSMPTSAPIPSATSATGSAPRSRVPRPNGRAATPRASARRSSTRSTPRWARPPGRRPAPRSRSGSTT